MKDTDKKCDKMTTDDTYRKSDEKMIGNQTTIIIIPKIRDNKINLTWKTGTR